MARSANAPDQAQNQIDLYRQIRSIDDADIRCPICLEPFIDPVESSCHHSFCKYCLATWFAVRNNNRCPSCRTVITNVQPLSILKLRIDELETQDLDEQQKAEREIMKTDRIGTDMLAPYEPDLFHNLLRHNIDNDWGDGGVMIEPLIFYPSGHVRRGFGRGRRNPVRWAEAENSLNVLHLHSVSVVQQGQPTGQTSATSVPAPPNAEVYPSYSATLPTNRSSSNTGINTNPQTQGPTLPETYERRLYTLGRLLEHVREEYNGLVHLSERDIQNGNGNYMQPLQQRLTEIGFTHHGISRNEFGDFVANFQFPMSPPRPPRDNSRRHLNPYEQELENSRTRISRFSDQDRPVSPPEPPRALGHPNREELSVPGYYGNGSGHGTGVSLRANGPRSRQPPPPAQSVQPQRIFHTHWPPRAHNVNTTPAYAYPGVTIPASFVPAHTSTPLVISGGLVNINGTRPQEPSRTHNIRHVPLQQLLTQPMSHVTVGLNPQSQSDGAGGSSGQDHGGQGQVNPNVWWM